MPLLSDLLDELRAAFAPLIEGATDPWVLERLLDTIGTDAMQLGGGGLVTQLAALGQAATELQGAIENPPDTLATVGTVLDATSRLVDAVRALSSGLPSGSEQLASDLVQHVMLRHLAHRWPLAYQIGIAAGFIDVAVSHQTPIVTGVRPIEVAVWSAFEQLLSDPVAALRGHFPEHPLATTADANATMDIAVGRFGGMATALGIPYRYGYAPDDAPLLGDFAPLLDRAVLLLAPPSWTDGKPVGAVISLSPADQEDLGVVVAPFGSFAIDKDLAFWHLNVQASADIQAVAFGGGQGTKVLASSGAVDANLAVTLTQPSVDGAPYVLGATKGTRFELQGATAHANVALTPDGHSVDLGIDVPHAMFVLTGDGGDGLLASVLGDRELRTTVDFGIAYTTARGLHLKSGSGLTVQLPVVLRVGPLSLEEVSVTIAPTAEAIDATVATTLGVTLGPVGVTVHGLGVRARATLPSQSPPRAFDLDYALQPPDGAGLAINAGPISGGGYLQHTDGVYSGSFALSAFGLALSAYGSLDARAKDGYSLAAVVNAQFDPIQLGLGFTLQGVGGMLGVHRTIDTEALRAALRGGGIDDIFFPPDPVMQAARLIGDLSRYFPEAPGRYVFGPAAKLGWGTPTIVTADLAVLLELPDPVRIVLLGNVVSALPSKDHALLRLEVEVLGELDVSRKTLAIDASLVNSQVVGFPLIGDLALRMAWGDPPSFVLSVGGFHSHFTPPPGFPALRRIRIPIGADDNPRLDIHGFLAVTSNTAQVGAQIELYASAGPLSLEGSVGFEALFQFSPFSFEIELSAGVSLKRGTSVLAGVHLDGTLTGPTPWHIAGEACLSLWFVDLCVHFSASFGPSQAVELPQTEIWPQLHAALSDRASWSAVLPSGAARVVTTASPVDETEAVRIDPVGAVVVRQKVAPLGREITRFGQAAPSGPARFTITTATLGTGDAHFDEVTDYFAPAQFEDLSDADKLSRAGYERMTSGASLATTAVGTSAELVTPLSYDTTLVVAGVVQPSEAFVPHVSVQLLACAMAAPPRAPLLVRGGGLADDAYVIADAVTLQPRPELAAPGARGAIEQALAAHLAGTPHEATSLVILPAFEVAA